MILNAENYYSKEANLEYMSVSTFKDFAGTYGIPGCEYRAYETLMGRWREYPSDAMLIGSYVDSYVEGQDSFLAFQREHPEMFRSDGNLYGKYRIGETVIRRIKRDKYFMRTLSGEKQVIMTGELFGRKWKIKMDSYSPGKEIADLKVVKNVFEQGRNPKEMDDPYYKYYVSDLGKVNWILYWGYEIQGAVYQEIVRQNTGEKLPFAIAAVSKQDYPEMEVIYLPQSLLDEALENVRYHMAAINEVLSGERAPDRCEYCDCCKDSKVLKGWRVMSRLE